MTAPTTRAERVAVVKELLHEQWGKLTLNVATDIVDALFPRTLREMPTKLGVVTYHEGEPRNPWHMRYHDTPLTVLRFSALTQVYSRIHGRLTDDEIERCLPLRKQPWEE